MDGTESDNSTYVDTTQIEELRQKEDVFINTTIGQTKDGKAEAGGFNNFNVTIKLTYKIRIINQAGVRAKATEIVNYYDNNFRFNGAYKDKEKTQRIEPFSTNDYSTSKYSTRGQKSSAPNYNTAYIQLDQWLENNQDEYIYVELEMIDPRTSLSGKLEPGGEGFKTLNYAEINGYETEIGVLDIDSIPGNIVEDGKGRFENGTYEDDEGKSPTFIIKNPGNKERIIQGTVFEDWTGKDEIQAYTGQERNGDGQYSEGSKDTPIVGAVVQLIEIDKNGNLITSAVDNGTGIRAETYTDSSGNYQFTKIPAGNYKVRFIYGRTDETVLLKDYNEGVNGANGKSYNGQNFKETAKNQSTSGKPYWYIENKETRNSDATDNQTRRNEVIGYSTTLTNHIAEVFNSWKDKQINRNLVDELKDKTYMYAETDRMMLEVENYEKYKMQGNVQQVPSAGDNQDYTYNINNVDFGIVERNRAELQITKKVSEINIVDSSGRKITGGTPEQIIKGEVDYIKMIPNNDETGEIGFADLEIDTELLSGAKLTITYEITVTNTSEAGNTISEIQVVDYVTNNLNYATDYGKNGTEGWNTVTTDQLAPYLNSTSLTSPDEANKIDLSTYQTILMTDFGTLAPSANKTKTLTLEKNLSSDEESDFDYENQVEIVQSKNANGRGDYSSIYGNLDPTTYTSRQGDLKWDTINTENENGFPQQLTITADGVTGVNSSPAIRKAEKDSGNAEEVVITPPTGTTKLVLQTQHYVLALIALTTLAGTIILIKKYIKINTK